MGKYTVSFISTLLVLGFFVILACLLHSDFIYPLVGWLLMEHFLLKYDMQHGDK